MNTDGVIAIISTIRDQAHKLIAEELAKYEDYALAPSHGSILTVLYQVEQMPMNELAKRIKRDKSTVTVLVNKLVELGYVQKYRDYKDRRVTVVTLTRKGWDLEPAFERISEVLIERTFKGFSDKDKVALVKGLIRIRENL